MYFSLDSLVCHNHPFGELHTSRLSVVLGVLSETMQRLVWGFLFLLGSCSPLGSYFHPLGRGADEHLSLG